MQKLMDKIMLTCRQSTFYSAIKNNRKLGLRETIKHRLHLRVCKACRQFDQQSDQIDKSMYDFLFNEELLAEEILPPEKKSILKDKLDQSSEK